MITEQEIESYAQQVVDLGDWSRVIDHLNDADADPVLSRAEMILIQRLERTVPLLQKVAAEREAKRDQRRSRER
jgi:hypothetical protein